MAQRQSFEMHEQSRHDAVPPGGGGRGGGTGVSFGREPRLLPLLLQHRLEQRLASLRQHSPSQYRRQLDQGHFWQQQPDTNQKATIVGSPSGPPSASASSALQVAGTCTRAATSRGVQVHRAGIAARRSTDALKPGTTTTEFEVRAPTENGAIPLVPRTRTRRQTPKPPTESGSVNSVAATAISQQNEKSTTTSSNLRKLSRSSTLLLLAPNDDNSASLALHDSSDSSCNLNFDFNLDFLRLHNYSHLQLHVQPRRHRFTGSAKSPQHQHQQQQLRQSHNATSNKRRLITTTVTARSRPPPSNGAMSPSVLLDSSSGGTGAGSAPVQGRKPAAGQQSALAKLVMNGKLNASNPPRSTPPTSSPALHSQSSPAYSDSEHLSVLPPPARDGTLLTPAMAAVMAPQSSLKGMHDLTDTPQLPLSLNSTAPSSPRIPPLRQNSGTQTPRVRPHATTLNIPGMTRSKVSPDGRIPQRDVAAKLVIIMVGLPARGKSYITKKLQRYLSWQQHESQVFNVGNRRRKTAGKTVHAHPKLSPEPARLDPPVQAAATAFFNGIRRTIGQTSREPKADYFEPPSDLDLNTPKGEAPSNPIEEEEEDDDDEQSAKFFNPRNEKAAKVREDVAMETLDELLDYLLEGGGSVGILDATNSTVERRSHLVERIKQREPKLGILFIESICRDKKLLEANMRLKLYGPDYRDKDPLKSLADFKERVAAYESAYVPLGEWEEENDLQYIQMVDVGRKLIQHRLRGFLSGGISTYLGSFNLSPRQIWITRHGQSMDNELGKLGGNSPLTERGHCYAQALHKFITHKRKEWLINEKSKEAQATFPPLPGDNTPPYPEKNRELEEKNFCVWTSMLKRSVETAEYFDVDDDYDVKNWEMLNELNAGQFEGMTYADIAREHPGEFNKRTRDKLNYIYPGVGGEGYLQVISRLRDMVREMERITDHVLIIGHRSVCRVLMAYFMDLTREDITDMDVPLGALYAIEPKPYGIAFHAYKYNEQNAWFDEMPNHTPTRAAHGMPE